MRGAHRLRVSVQCTTLDFFDNVILGGALTKVMQFAFGGQGVWLQVTETFDVSEDVRENGHQAVIIFGRHMLVAKA